MAETTPFSVEAWGSLPALIHPLVGAALKPQLLPMACHFLADCSRMQSVGTGVLTRCWSSFFLGVSHEVYVLMNLFFPMNL